MSDRLDDSHVIGTRHDPHAQARAARNQPLLLHSMTLFEEIFALIFEHRQINTVVEIGVESGKVSETYLNLGAETVYCVEPAPTPELRGHLNKNEQLRLVERPSPEALTGLPVADLYVIDGDHNYATVSTELQWIAINAPDAVVVLHDVMWPCSRRDQYYQPSTVDSKVRHPCSDCGPSVWHDDVTPTGFLGHGSFTSAIEAGGEANGVLTAVEDVLETTPSTWWLEIIPAVFGMGVVVRETSHSAQLLRDRLKPYSSSRLLSAMENNRIALYTRVLQMQYEAAAHATDADELANLLAEQRSRLEALESQLERERHRADQVRDLRAQNLALKQEINRIRRQLSPGPSIKRWANKVLPGTSSAATQTDEHHR